MRWSQGVWSEERLKDAVNRTDEYFALPYGPSSVAPDNPKEVELYFERLDAAGYDNLKRPDLLLFNKRDEGKIEKLLQSIGGKRELPFTKEKDDRMQELLKTAFLAIECENSLWIAKQMPHYGSELTPQKRLKGKLGLKKSAVVPTIILKDEDRKPLRQWQNKQHVPIHIWHVFYDLAYGISLKDAERVIGRGLIEPTVQIFQAPGGATTRKEIYKIYYHHGYELATSTEDPELLPATITDRNGHILPYVRFSKGTLNLTDTAVELLKSVSNERNH
jgi:hypothetical protein